MVVESVLLLIGMCLQEVGDADGAWYKARAFQVAAARLKPPAVALQRLAAGAAYAMVIDYRFAEATDYFRHAFENASALPDAELRAKFVNRLIPGQVVALAYSGATEEAKRLGEAFVAQIDTDPSIRTDVADVYLPDGLSFAQRQNGRFDAAIATALRAEQRFVELKFENNVRVARAWRAAALLDAGRSREALTAVNEDLVQAPAITEPQNADVLIIYGRALLANGHAAEALEPLRLAYGFWLGHDSKSAFAAEAEYWFGRAWIANGNTKRGKWMVAEAREALAKSPLPLHRTLAASK
jgi:hypothetical protein